MYRGGVAAVDASTASAARPLAATSRGAPRRTSGASRSARVTSSSATEMRVVRRPSAGGRVPSTSAIITGGTSPPGSGTGPRAGGSAAVGGGGGGAGSTPPAPAHERDPVRGPAYPCHRASLGDVDVDLSAEAALDARLVDPRHPFDPSGDRARVDEEDGVAGLDAGGEADLAGGRLLRPGHADALDV